MISRKIRTILSNITVSVVSICVLLVLFLVVDVLAHMVMSAYSGYNIRGYRGKLVGSKRPDEIRVVVLGGSCAFGYGVRAHQSIPYYLAEILNERFKSTGKKFTVINLAYNNESAVCFKSTLRQYECLDPDIVLSYSGYNDFAPNYTLYRTEKSAFRNGSLIFRKTGYMPILPLIVRDVYYKVKYWGNSQKGYRQPIKKNFLDECRRKFSFNRASTNILKGKRYLTQEEINKAAVKKYIGYICNIVSTSIYSGKGFVFVKQPKIFESAFTKTQQDVLREELLFRFDDNDLFAYIDLYGLFGYKIREDLPGDISFDGMHLTKEGNRVVAEEIARKLDKFIEKITLRM